MIDRRENIHTEGTDMVQLIVGKKGKGKTKHLLSKVNDSIQSANGSICYLDKSTKHMYELNNKVRLIDVSEYLVTNSSEFVGFICGIISQDHDLEEMYLDSFIKIACLEGQDLVPVISKLEEIGEKYSVNFVLSVSMDESELPETIKKNVIVSL